jgi:hypothetical protein
MLCYPKPCVSVANPYPETGAKIASVVFCGDLVLFRPKDRLLSVEDGSVIRPANDVYLTGAPYVVRWFTTNGEAREVTVPAGFITDLTSVPGPLRLFAGRVGPWLEAAVLHDYLYAAWQDYPQQGHTETDRRFSDDMMLAAMTASEVPWWQRWGIYLAVRAFGAASYHTPRRLRYANCDDARIMHLRKIPDHDGRQTVYSP